MQPTFDPGTMVGYIAFGGDVLVAAALPARRAASVTNKALRME
jgi:hypothetical protein